MQRQSLFAPACCLKYWPLAVSAVVIVTGWMLTTTVSLLGAAGNGAGPIAWENDLAPITAADWDYQKAAHLLERGGFGDTPEAIERLATMTPQAAVDWLVNYERQPDTAPAYNASPIWDPGMDPFPKSRAEAVRIARETGESMGVTILPDGTSRLCHDDQGVAEV